MRVVASFILSFALVVSSLSSVMAVKHSTITPQEYVDYLTEKGKEDSEALKVRQQFMNLSDEDQQKFINYMCDPKVMEEVVNIPVPENSRKELRGGDIVVEHKSETEVISETEGVSEEKESKVLTSITALFCGSCFAAPSKKEYRHTDTRNIVIGSLKVGSTTAWVQYTVVNWKVTSIQDGGGCNTNYSPVSTWTKDSVNKYIYANKAHTAVVWKVSPCLITKYLSLSAISFTHHHHVLGNANGGKSYRAYRG